MFILAALLVASLAPSTGAAPLGTRKFKMPSRNIHCLLSNGTLRCDIRSGLNPEPKRDCDFDWGALSLRVRSRAKPLCISDTIADPDATTLRYGKKWKRRGIVCTSRRTGLRCRNRVDHGFFLSRRDWDRF